MTTTWVCYDCPHNPYGEKGWFEIDGKPITDETVTCENHSHPVMQDFPASLSFKIEQRKNHKFQ